MAANIKISRFGFTGEGNMNKVKLKSRKACKAAYIEHVGSYDTIPFDVNIKKLYGWAKENRLRPGFMPFTIYPDDPNTTPKEQLRSWVAITVSGDARPGGGVAVLEMPETEVASYKHEAPASEYGNSYKVLVDWVTAENYEITGPPAEYYHKKPKVKGGQVIIFAEIQFPVRKR